MDKRGNNLSKEKLEDWRINQPYRLLNDKTIIAVLDALKNAYDSYEKIRQVEPYTEFSTFYRPLLQALSAELIERAGGVTDYVYELVYDYSGGDLKNIEKKFPSFDIKYYKLLIEMYCTGVINRAELIKQMVYERYTVLMKKLDST